MGKIGVAGLGGKAEKEVGVITLTYGGKTSFTASEVTPGLQRHLSRNGYYGGKDYVHDVYFKNAAGTDIGTLRYGQGDSYMTPCVWQCNFADTSKFVVDVADGSMKGLCLNLWAEKASDGTLSICDSTGAEVLLTGVSSVAYKMSSSDTSIMCVFIAFLKEA